MPAKKRMPRNTGIILMRPPMHGQGAFDFLVKPLGKVNKALKRTKIISRGLTSIAPLLGPKYGGIATGVGMGAGMLGYGRKRKKRKVGAKKKKKAKK